MIIAAPIPDAPLQAPEGSDFERGGSQAGDLELEGSEPEQACQQRIAL